MPFLTAFSPAWRPIPRRTVLQVGAAAALAGPGVAGCSAASNKQPAATPTATKPPGPDPQLADLTAEIELLVRYDATLKAHPALRARLRPLRADHAVHQAKLHSLVGEKGKVAVARPA
ncbi:MAG TPA: hypothetical protein VHC49_10625, partial [Mycobacteriales bacterium]|nr:hypothetical protein [Mycobacteriales bacterium]